MPTRTEIQEVFKNMILRDAKRVSVQSICKEVNISRKTFYKYYYDIEDLVSNIIQQDIFNPLTTLSTMTYIKVEDSITVLNSMYSTIYDHRDFYTKLYYIYRKENLLNRCIYEQNIKLNETIFKSLQEEKTKKEYLIHLAAMSGVNLIEKWINDEFTLTSREISTIFYKYVSRAWVELQEQYR